MPVTVTALQNFVHCAFDMKKGDKLPMSEQTAADLRAVGLVAYADAGAHEVLLSQEGQAPAPKNKMLPAPENRMAKNARTKGK